MGNDDDRLALMPRCYLLYSMLGSLVERCPILAAGPGERHIAPVAPAAVHLRVTHRKLVYGQPLYLTEPDLFQTLAGKRRQVQRLTDNLRCPPGTAERAAVERIKGLATSRQVGGPVLSAVEEPWLPPVARPAASVLPLSSRATRAEHCPPSDRAVPEQVASPHGLLPIITRSQQWATPTTGLASVTNLPTVSDLLQVMIDDDGQGFDLEAAREADCFGLRGMSERAAMLDAELRVESSPGQGARISTNVPLL